MDRVLVAVARLFRRHDGQDLLEYALLVALIALVAVLAITATGQNVQTIFTNIAAALAPATDPNEVRGRLDLTSEAAAYLGRGGSLAIWAPQDGHWIVLVTRRSA